MILYFWLWISGSEKIHRDCKRTAGRRPQVTHHCFSK